MSDRPVRKRPPRKAPTRALSTPNRHAPPIGLDTLFDRIVTVLEDARSRVARTVCSETVLAYWHIGREIVEHLQGGDPRADYGDELLETLSHRLNVRFGRGYSVSNLRYFRLFCQAFADREPRIRHEARDEFAAIEIHHDARDELVEHRICHKACDELVDRRIGHGTRGQFGDPAQARETAACLEGFSDRLSWTHYRSLAQVEQPAERSFYEIEAEREGWSSHHLERQIHTHLFARLLKSRDKAGVMDLANLMHMRAFAEAWPDPAGVQQVVGQLSWGANLLRLTRMKTEPSGRFYATKAIAHGSSPWGKQ